MHIKVEIKELEEWIEMADDPSATAAVCLKKGRQVDCIALSFDAAPGKARKGLADAMELTEVALSPLHGVAYRSFSVMERVLAIHGQTNSPYVHFDCPRFGENQNRFDLECHIDAAETPDEPVLGFLGASLRRQEIDVEDSIRIAGRLELVRGVRDELEEKYDLLYKLA